MRYTFSDVPGKAGDTSLPANPLTNIRQLVPPPAGPHRDLLERLGYPFGGVGVGDEAVRTTRLSRTILATQEAGLFEKLDFMAVRTGGLTGSLVNIVPGKQDAINQGAAYSGGSIRTDGVSTYVDLNLSANREHYTLNNACIWAHFDDEPDPAPSIGPLVGRTTGSQYLILARHSGVTTRVQFRMNSSNTLNYENLGIVDPETMWRPGLWMMERTSANDVALYRDGEKIGSNDSNASVALPTQIAIGVNSANFAKQAVSAMGYGAALSPDEREALRQIIKAHRAVIRT